MTQLYELPEVRVTPLERPPGRWRNWWWSDIEYRTPDGMLGPGMHGGTRLHPSRDVALTHADEIIAKFCPLFPELGLEHVGAFREGERPEGAP